MSEIAANSSNLPSWNEEMALLLLSLDGSIAEFRERDRDRVLGPQYSSLSELGPDIMLSVSKLSEKIFNCKWLVYNWWSFHLGGRSTTD